MEVTERQAPTGVMCTKVHIAPRSTALFIYHSTPFNGYDNKQSAMMHKPTLQQEEKDQHIERSSSIPSAEDEDIPFSSRTYVALAVFMFLQFWLVWSLAVSSFLASFIVADLGNESLQNWIPIVPSVGQAVFSPFISFASDQFGERRYWLIGPLVLGFVGAIVSGFAKSVPILLVGQAFASIGLATTAISYAAPSEILPRRFRPMAQALVNFGAAAAQVGGIMISGALLKRTPTGWRWVYHIQAIIGGITVVLLLAIYRPAVVPNRVKGNFWQRLHRLDLVGNLLFGAGLTTLIVGISAGNNPYPWTNARPIALTCVGFVVLVIFSLWEWKRKDGLLSAELFQHRNFALTIVAIFVEGIILFGFQVFAPQEIGALWEQRTLLIAARSVVFPAASIALAIPIGYFSAKYKSTRALLVVGYVMYTAGLIGLCTAEVGTNQVTIAYAALGGAGFSPLLVLLVVSAQLATPPHLIATATAILVSSRALGASVGTSFLGAILSAKISAKVPSYIAKSVLPLQLPATSLRPFIGALASGNVAAVANIPGATPRIIEAGVAAFKHALVDSFRYVWISTVPFAVLGLLSVVVLRSSADQMSWTIDAPLKGEHYHHHERHEHAIAHAA